MYLEIFFLKKNAPGWADNRCIYLSKYTRVRHKKSWMDLQLNFHCFRTHSSLSQYSSNCISRMVYNISQNLLPHKAHQHILLSEDYPPSRSHPWLHTEKQEQHLSPTSKELGRYSTVHQLSNRRLPHKTLY